VARQGRTGDLHQELDVEPEIGHGPAIQFAHGLHTE
jgi:hypothetical protein